MIFCLDFLRVVLFFRLLILVPFVARFFLVTRFFPPPNCFFTVLEADLLSALFTDVLPATTSPICGRDDSTKSRPSFLAAGKKYFLIIGKAVRATVPARAPKPLPRCLGTPLKHGVDSYPTIYEFSIW